MGFLTEVNCPVFNAEKLKSVPERDKYELLIGGNVKNGGSYLLDDFLSNFQQKMINSRLTSVSGWSVRCDWYGVRWQDFIEWVKPEDYTYVYFESYGGYITAVEKRDLDNPRILLATKVGSEEIEFDYGGPFRSVIPNLWGYKSCKWIKRIHFMNDYIRGFWESYGYEDRGLIQPGMTMDVNTGEQKRIKGGEVLEF